MASEKTPIGGVEQPEPGENLNIWGLLINAVIQRLTEMGVGVKALALSGNKTLTTDDFDENESRWGALRFSDNGLTAIPTVTLPAETRYWLVINTGSAYAIDFVANGSAADPVTVAAQKWAFIDCDGTDLFVRDLSTLNGTVPVDVLPGALQGDIQTIAAIETDVQLLADLEDGTISTAALSTVAAAAPNLPPILAIQSDIQTVAANIPTIVQAAEIYAENNDVSSQILFMELAL